MALTSTRRASASLKADAALLYEVLTDYDAVSDWLPGVSASKALAREGDLAIAEFILAGARKDRLVCECIHTRNKMVLWRTIEGLAPVTQAEWRIDTSGGGTQVSLQAEGRLQWSRFFGPYSKFLEPRSCLKALEAQAGAFMPEIALTDESGERILDLVETEQGVICWIRGKKYVLQEDAKAGS